MQAKKEARKMPQPQIESNADEKDVSTASQPRSTMSLKAKVALRLSLGLVIGPSIVLIPAGTWKFWQGWVFLAILYVPAFAIFLYFLKHDPQLIERRLRFKEKVREQQLLMRWVKPLFFGAFMLPGFDYRFGWSRDWLGEVPLWLTVISEAMVLAGYLSVAWVLNVNRFAGRTIEVEAGQTVISSGPYRFVRHPLYAGSAVLCLFTPLALGSCIALPAFVLLLPFYVFRLLNEEKVLCAQLPGYSEYCLRTRYRLIPFVW
jgi:protein-S-isoprenylcysteine O-methyltransferase Ste14